MASNPAQLDEYWDQPEQTQSAPPYMQANSALRPFNDAFVTWEVVKPVPLNVLGVQINWTPDGREFPEGVLAAISRLYQIYDLEENWDSYGGRTADVNLIRPALSLILAAHNRGCATRVTPLTDGGLGLRMETAKAEIDLDLRPSGIVEITVEELETGEIHELTAENAEDAPELIETYI